MNEIKANISEQEFADLHIVRRSVHPLIIRLVLWSAISFFILLAYCLIISAINFRNFTSSLTFNLIGLLILQSILSALFFIIVAKWLGDFYIIKLPEITIRTGFLTVVEKKTSVLQTPNVTIVQGILGKIFDYGNVVVKGAMVDGSDLVMTDVQDPRHIADIFKAKPDQLV